MITPSGGLVYHARALREFDRWRPTRCHVSHCLKTWLRQTQPEHLIIFGPSAGYLLDSDCLEHDAGILKNLKYLTVVDPDYLARPIFNWRHAIPDAIEFDWVPDPMLLPQTSIRETDFQDFIRATSLTTRTAIFFAGVLGQLHFHRKSFRRDEHLAQNILLQQLAPYPWASLHDLESKSLSKKAAESLSRSIQYPDQYLLPREVTQNQVSRIEWLENQFMPRHQENSGSLPSEWIDHGTGWIGEPTTATLWRLTKTTLHLLGFTSS
jgi:hypothetical protein